MSSRVNATNRTVLTLLALLCLAAGVLGLVLSYGGFGATRSTTPVLPQQARDFAASNTWFWWAVAVACLILALLGLRWLIAQLRTDRVTRLDLTTDDRAGLTTVHVGALTDAVQEEVEGIRGVTSASAHVRGEPTRRLSLTVDLTDYADIADVRRQLEEQTVAHARQAIDDPGLPVDIELRPGRARAGGRGLD